MQDLKELDLKPRNELVDESFHATVVVEDPNQSESHVSWDFPAFHPARLA